MQKAYQNSIDNIWNVNYNLLWVRNVWQQEQSEEEDNGEEDVEDDEDDVKVEEDDDVDDEEEEEKVSLVNLVVYTRGHLTHNLYTLWSVLSVTIFCKAFLKLFHVPLAVGLMQQLLRSQIGNWNGTCIRKKTNQKHIYWSDAPHCMQC